MNQGEYDPKAYVFKKKPTKLQFHPFIAKSDVTLLVDFFSGQKWISNGYESKRLMTKG